MATGSLRINRDIILATRRRYLEERQLKTPPEAMMALAAMQPRPWHILSSPTEDNQVRLIGQITLSETYDPVLTALRFIRAGVDALSFFTDHTIYNHDLDDLLIVVRGIQRMPVVYQNYIFNEYGVVAVRAAGASAIVLYASVLSPDMLRLAVSAAQRWKMDAIVQVDTEEQLQHALELSPHVIIIGDPARSDPQRAMDILEQLHSHIPFHMQMMLSSSLHRIEDVEVAVEMGVNAVIVGDNFLASEAMMARLHRTLRRD